MNIIQNITYDIEKTHYPDGNICSVKLLSDTIKHFSYFYPNGQLQEKYTINMFGFYVGEVVRLYPDGGIKLIAKYDPSKAPNTTLYGKVKEDIEYLLVIKYYL